MQKSSYEKLLISTKAGENGGISASRPEFEKLWCFTRERKKLRSYEE